jgi:regulator of sigma E protease
VRSEGEPLKTIGVAPPTSLTLMQASRDAPRDPLVAQFATWGLAGVEPGMRVVAIDAEPVEPDASPESALQVDSMERVRAAAAEGRPFTLTFRDESTGHTVETSVRPIPEFNSYPATFRTADHILGLIPLMKVQLAAESSRGYQQGLRTGDVFLRIADVDYPSAPQAIEQIQMHAGRNVALRLLRDGQTVDLGAAVDAEGRIGFEFANALDTPTIARAPLQADARKPDLPAGRIDPPLPPGSTIVSIDGAPVASFLDLRAAIQRATLGAPGATLSIQAIPPGGAEPRTHTWALTPDDARAVASLGWTIEPGLEAQFQIATFTLRADDPLGAMVMGVRKTHRIMMLTYLTFQRLVQGTVSPKELRGPVGITHIGSQYAAQGFVYLLFFLALISANLAVINFLPIPIVDGGLFLMLLYEGITRRPVPIIVQNIATAIGLALIATAFIFVTVQDIGRLF